MTTSIDNNKILFLTVRTNASFFLLNLPPIFVPLAGGNVVEFFEFGLDAGEEVFIFALREGFENVEGGDCFLIGGEGEFVGSMWGKGKGERVSDVGNEGNMRWVVEVAGTENKADRRSFYMNR